MISTFKKFNKVPKTNKFGEPNMMEGIIYFRHHLNTDMQYRSKVPTAPKFYKNINSLTPADRSILYTMAQLMTWDNTLKISILELSKESNLSRPTVTKSIDSLLSEMCFIQLIKKHCYVISPVYFTKGTAENITAALNIWDMALQECFDSQEKEFTSQSKSFSVPEGMPFLVF